MHNWFSVGEKVLVLSNAHYPDIGGEYKIKLIISKDEAMIRGNIPKEYWRVFSSSVYFVIDGLKFKDKAAETFYDFVPSSYLRKKYPPSSEGFQSLISKIKDNVLEGVE